VLRVRVDQHHHHQDRDEVSRGSSAVHLDQHNRTGGTNGTGSNAAAVPEADVRSGRKNSGPVTCTIDNPAALHYFARWVDPLLKLGPDATPEQVAHQLQTIANQSSGPITCSVYALAQRAEGWHFAVSPTGRVTEDC